MTHWLAGLWSALWPNVVAPSLWTLLGIGASHWHQLREHRKTRERIGQDSTEREAQ